MTATTETTTIQYPTDCELHECAAKSEGRYAMHGVAIIPGEKARLVATDGECMAVVDLDQSIPERETGFDHIQVLPVGTVTKAASMKSQPGITVPVAIDGSQASVTHPKGHTVSERISEGPFPRFEGAIPDFIREDCKPVEITFNPELLLRVAKAIGAHRRDTPSVTIRFDSANPLAPIFVENACIPGRFGLVMPVSVDK